MLWTLLRRDIVPGAKYRPLGRKTRQNKTIIHSCYTDNLLLTMVLFLYFSFVLLLHWALLFSFLFLCINKQYFSLPNGLCSSVIERDKLCGGQKVEHRNSVAGLPESGHPVAFLRDGLLQFIRGPDFVVNSTRRDSQGKRKLSV